MSAELLREAAAKMREQHGPEHERHLMWSAMADWLTVVAEYGEPEPGRGTRNWAAALAVARAYLGRDDPPRFGYDHIELVNAPEGVHPVGPWVDRLTETPCPACRATTVFIHWHEGLTGSMYVDANGQHWSVKAAHDDDCPRLAKTARDTTGGTG